MNFNKEENLLEWITSKTLQLPEKKKRRENKDPVTSGYN